MLSGLFRGIVNRDSVDDVKSHLSVGRIPMEVVRLLASVQAELGAHPASCTVGTGGKGGRGVALTTHPHIALRLKKE
jgi:hypothetical protein